MINSSIFSQATTIQNIEDMKADISDNEKMVNRSILYHLILSFVTSINEDGSLMIVQRTQIVNQFGFSLGKHVTEEESLGNIKYFLPKGDKDKSKPFLGQFKFMNSKLWPCIFGSTSKLFAILPSGGDAGGYKIQDKDFGLTKWLSGDEQKVRLLRKLLLQLAKGALEGMLDKFDLTAEVTFSEVNDNNVYFEIKNLSKKQKTAFK